MVRTPRHPFQLERRAMLSIFGVGVVGLSIATVGCGRFRRNRRAVARTLPAALVEAIHGRPDRIEEKIVEAVIVSLGPHEMQPLEVLVKRPFREWPDSARRAFELVVARYATASAKFRRAVGAPTELPDHVTTCSGLARWPPT